MHPTPVFAAIACIAIIQTIQLAAATALQSQPAAETITPQAHLRHLPQQADVGDVDALPQSTPRPLIASQLPNASTTLTADKPSSDSTSTTPSPSSVRFSVANVAAFIISLYIIAVIVFSVSKRAQSYLVYLHWINPPTFLYPLTNLKHHRLSNNARNISVAHLRGWHLLPTGPPFAPTDVPDSYYDERLSAPRQRAILFFHGNCGTRAFPVKRVLLIKLLNAHFDAHIITVDYSGFGDSGGNPSEKRFYADARLALQWVCKRVHPTSSVFMYGQSLGSFAATHAAAAASSHISTISTCDEDAIADDFQPGIEPESDSVDRSTSGTTADVALLSTTGGSTGRRLTGVILDAPPASLQTAARTHPVVQPFRLTGLSRAFHHIIKERLDSTQAIEQVRAGVLIVHGRADNMIPSWQGRLLADRAKQAGNRHVRFVEFENVGHVDVCAAEGYLQTVFDFIHEGERRCDVGPVRTRTII